MYGGIYENEDGLVDEWVVAVIDVLIEGLGERWIDHKVHLLMKPVCSKSVTAGRV